MTGSVGSVAGWIRWKNTIVYTEPQTANWLISTGYGCICVLIATGEQTEYMAREEKNVI